jgi:heme-degrading monooxygenase HmoA
MWVRIATFEGGDTEKLQNLNEERMSSGEMTPPEGMNHVLLLADPGKSRRLFVSFFDSRDAIAAAEAGFEKMGDEVPEDIRGRRTGVDYHEVVIFDGDIDRAKAARVSSLDGSPDAIDEGVEKTRGETLAKVRELEGNVGAIGLADRDSGRVTMITLWDSADSLRASEQQADKIREQTAEMGGQRIASVDRYDVAMSRQVTGARA